MYYNMFYDFVVLGCQPSSNSGDICAVQISCQVGYLAAAMS